MTQTELIAEISLQRGLPRKTIAAVLDTLGHVVAAELGEGADEVSLPGLGKFRSINKAARPGRNPRTGEVVTVSARRVPTFSAGKEFREAVNR